MRISILPGCIALLAATAATPLLAQSDGTSRTLVLPYLGSAPETGFQYGATVFRVQQPADSATRPSTAQLFASYTAKKQARIFAEVDRWSAGSVWHVTGHLEWKRFPLPFYGFGDRTAESAEEFYTPSGIVALAVVQRRVRGPLYVLGGYGFQDLRIRETLPTGVLVRRVTTGDGGGRVGQLRAGAIWDDRDDIFAARRGSFLQATGFVATSAFASEYEFSRFIADARHYVSLGSGRVLALQAVTELTGGTPPFDQMSLVGNSSYLRGYTQGRFRDRDLAAVQAEYRASLWRKLGWAAFAGAGRIAPRPGMLVDGSARTLPSYGIGGRWSLFSNSRSAIRVDYARGGDGQSGLYVALNEAF